MAPPGTTAAAAAAAGAPGPGPGDRPGSPAGENRRKRAASREAEGPEVAAAAAGPGPSGRRAGGPAAAPKHLRIVHFNDVYNVDPGEREPVGGAARFVAATRRAGGGRPAAEGGALVLFSGDAYNPSLMSTVTKGEQMPPVLNALHVACACMGNHEFDFGLERLVELNARCHFPWLMANVLDPATREPLAGARRTQLLEWGGVRVGLVGLVEREWLATLATLDEADILYLDFVAEGRRLARELRAQGAEVVIALTHSRMPNDIKLGEQVEEIDLVLGGHDHNFDVKSTAPHGTLVIKSGTDFREFSTVDVCLRPGRRPTVTWRRTEVTSEFAEDPEVKAVVDGFSRQLGHQMGAVIGASSVDLDGRFEVLRTQESNLGNFVADIWRHSAGAEIALLNSGTIRSDQVHPSGQLTMKDLVLMLPMLDENVLISITGRGVWAALENGVSQYPRLDGRFPQVSGMQFEFNPRLAPGARITKVLVDGESIELDREYKMAVKEYLLEGKDGYTSLKDAKVLVSGEDSPYLVTILRNFFSNLAVAEGWDSAAEDGIKEIIHAFKAPGKAAGKRGPARDGVPGANKIAPGLEGRIVKVA